MAAAGDTDLHVVFLPYLTPSHMIPLINIARVFAARGVRSTIIATVHNALLIKPSIDLDIAAGHPISIKTLDFPATKVGLPVGIENFTAVTSLDMSSKVYYGIMLLQNPMEQLIRDLSPDCIFSDMFFPWTIELADELGVPRILCYTGGFFFRHSVLDSLMMYAPQENVKSESESFLVPNLPTRVEMKRSRLDEHLKVKTPWGDVLDAIHESEDRSYGLVLNTFYELEPAYADHFKKSRGLKAWHVGPIFQFLKNEEFAHANGGVAPAPKKHSCLTWLDSHKPNSVVFVCFGSMVFFPEAQLTEIAAALEESGRPFLWVVRTGIEKGQKDISWLPEGFQERVARGNKGMIMNEWAPQEKILEHPAVGAFITHCGTGSLLEAFVAGMPLITWPLYADHFYNEKLVLDLVGVGVPVGSEVWNLTFEIKSPIVKKENIVNAIGEIMDESSEKAKTIRHNAKELAIKAKKTVLPGGSSDRSLMALIQELKAIKIARKC